MISLISSALIMWLSPCEALAHLRQLPVETAVNDVAADLGDEAAEKRRVHALLHENALAERGPEPPGELLLLGVGERDGRAHGGACLPEVLVDQTAVGGHDLAQVIDPAAL